MNNLKKTFIVQHRHWVANCVIEINSKIVPGVRSKHPDFEDATPRAREEFDIRGFVNGKLVDSVDTQQENMVVTFAEKIEKSIREKATGILMTNEIVTTEQSLKAMGYE